MKSEQLFNLLKQRNKGSWWLFHSSLISNRTMTNRHGGVTSTTMWAVDSELKMLIFQHASHHCQKFLLNSPKNCCGSGGRAGDPLTRSQLFEWSSRLKLYTDIYTTFFQSGNKNRQKLFLLSINWALIANETKESYFLILSRHGFVFSDLYDSINLTVFCCRGAAQILYVGVYLHWLFSFVRPTG